MDRFAAVAAVAAGALALAAPAVSQAPPPVLGPYAGQLPFNCELQNAGTGPDFPDPGADPSCVEFDKTNQNLTGLGLAEFTAREPARMAAASNKCFYFQRDHWTGSVVGRSEPELWHWDGDYYFDRARGVGGVSVRNFRSGGQPQSAAAYVPGAYEPYFDEEGGGGAEVLLESGPDPACATRVDTPEERDRVYGARAAELRCIEPGGAIRGRRVGLVRLGAKRERVRSLLGPPSFGRLRVDSWCLAGKGELRVAYARGGRTQAILTSGRGQSFRGVARGDRLRRARRELEIAQRLNLRSGWLFILRGLGERRQVWLGARDGRVRWVLVQAPGRIRAATFARLVRRVP